MSNTKNILFAHDANEQLEEAALRYINHKKDYINYDYAEHEDGTLTELHKKKPELNIHLINNNYEYLVARYQYDKQEGWKPFAFDVHGEGYGYRIAFMPDDTIKLFGDTVEYNGWLQHPWNNHTELDRLLDIAHQYYPAGYWESLNN